MTSSLLDVDDDEDTLLIFTPLPNRVLTSQTDTSFFFFLINLVSLSVCTDPVSSPCSKQRL